MSTADTPDNRREPVSDTWTRWNGDVIAVEITADSVARATLLPERLGARTLGYAAAAPAPTAREPAQWTARDAAFIVGFAAATYLLAIQMDDVGTRAGLPAMATHFIVSLLAYCMELAPIVALAKRRGGLVQALDLRSVPRDWIINVPLIAIAVLAATSLWAGLLSNILAADPRQCSVIHAAADVNFFFGLALPVLVAPLVEEAIFRGVLFNWLRSRVGRNWGVVGSTLVFAAFHLKAYGLMTALQVAPVGATLAVVYDVSGSLVPGMAVHLLFNLAGYLGAVHGC